MKNILLNQMQLSFFEVLALGERERERERERETKEIMYITLTQLHKIFKIRLGTCICMTAAITLS